MILSLAAAPNGDLWVGTPDGLNRIRNGTVTTFTWPTACPMTSFVRCWWTRMARFGSALVAGLRTGATIGAHMDIFTQATGLGSDLVGAMARDTHGDLWVATLAGLSRLQGVTNSAIANFTSANGLSSNVITALLAAQRRNPPDWHAGSRVELVGWAALFARRKRPA